MKLKQVINRNPDILGGTLIFAGTRVPVQALIDSLKGGNSLDDFLEGFPSVSREQAIAFLEMALTSIEKIDHLAERIDPETSIWLSADISGELPPYNWGEEGVPEGDAIEYHPDIGFVVIEEGEK